MARFEIVKRYVKKLLYVKFYAEWKKVSSMLGVVNSKWILLMQGQI